MAFYALTKDDVHYNTASARHCQEIAAQWFSLIEDDMIDGNIEAVIEDQWTISGWYAVARVKMGLVESDYDWESK